VSEHRQSSDRDAASVRERMDIAAAVGPSATFWLASLASLCMIIGGVGPWATAFTLMSLSGTSMGGWREVIAGVVGLALLGLHQLLGARLPLILAAVAGALGAMQAIATRSKIHSGGAVTVLGQQYRYLDAAWGLYLVLAGAIALLCSSAALAWRASR
jgi:hypothetical protein